MPKEEVVKTGKHLYKRGWWGLIPLIGGIIGIWLIVSGVFRYKDKKLVLIGVAALLFTVSIYSAQIYYFRYSTLYRKNFSQFCQPQMDELIKSIEFYKVEHGVYPDSLEQLKQGAPLVRIDDPIAQESNRINKGLFFYKNAGNKYYLFSAGVDRVPFTEDDILPSAKYFDSTKTGLTEPIR